MKNFCNIKKIYASLLVALVFVLPFAACDLGNKNSGTSDTYISYSVTFDSRGGSLVSDLNSSTTTGKIAKPADPQRSGYSFDTWYTSDNYDAVFNFDSIITENITLYAKWTASKTLDIKNPPATAVELETQFEANKWVNVEILENHYWVIWGIHKESFEGVQSVVMAYKYEPEFYTKNDYEKIDENTIITEESAFVFYFNDAAAAQNAFNVTKADMEKRFNDLKTTIEAEKLRISMDYYSYTKNDKTISLYSIASWKKGEWDFFGQ